VRIEVCLDLVINIGVGMPSSAAWVSAEKVAQVVEGPPPGGVGEQLGGAAVRQPGSAGVWIEVGRGELHAGGPVGEEHRASAAVGEVAGIGTGWGGCVTWARPSWQHNSRRVPDVRHC
jgi:hypothetical protein